MNRELRGVDMASHFVFCVLGKMNDASERQDIK